MRPLKLFRLANLSVLLAALAACSAPPPPPTLEVWYSGCVDVLGPAEQPSCVLAPESELRLWLRAPADAALEICAGARCQPPTAGEPVDGGSLVRLEPGEASQLEVVARRAGTATSWRLPLVAFAEPEPLVRARELLDGEAEKARQLVEGWLPKAARPIDRAVALRLLAAIEGNDGALDTAAALLREAAEICRRERHLSTEIDILTELFRLHFYQRDDLEAARATLDLLPTPARGDAYSAYLAAYFRGAQAKNLGDARTALRELEAAATHARRLGLAAELASVAQVQADQWNRLGRFEETLALLEPLEHELTEGCARAELLNNLAWNRILAWEAGSATPMQETVAQTRARLEAAIELAALCSDGEVKSLQANAHLNGALTDLHAREPAPARAHLAAARALNPEPEWWQRVWRHEVEARLALAEDRAAEALVRYRELEALGAQTLAAETRWRALVGSAQALATLGERAAALAALEKAEALADELLARAAIDAGREAAVVVWEAGTRRHLELLLAADQPELALVLARRARSRVLRGLLRSTRLAELPAAERQRWVELSERYRQLRHALEEEAGRGWQLPLDQRRDLETRRQAQEREQRELLDAVFSLLGDQALGTSALPALRPGELLLAYHPLPEGWVAFAADAERGVEARRIELPARILTDHGALAARLLVPFRDRISAARRIRVLPYGPLRTVDFHALPFDDGILLEIAPVVYGLDLPTPEPPRDDPAARRALVLADPTRTLLEAPAEAEDVRERLAAAGWQVELPAALDAAQLRRRLGEVALFHFAGHADFSGRGGWDSALHLAAGSRLRPGDILTAPRLPRLVVLSACAASLSAPGAGVEGLGLASAFVLGGTRQTVGAIARVDDGTTRALMAVFYRALGEGHDGAEALRRAQLSVRRRDPASGWASFRLVEP